MADVQRESALTEKAAIIPAEKGENTPRPAGAIFLVALALAAAAALTPAFRHYPHSRLVFIFLLYCAALPSLVWFWRESRADEESAFSIPDLRAPVIVVFALITGITGFTYNHGHTLPDESSYRFQARVFAAGEWKAEPMPGAAANARETPPEIDFEHQAHTTRGWFSKYPPVWPLVLAIGYLTGCPWAINPLLGVLLLVLVNYLARSWGRTTQIAAVALAACSAYTMLYSTGFLSHALMAVIGTAAIAAIFHGVSTKRTGLIALGFLLVVTGTEVRPYTGAVIALWCTGYVLYALWRKKRLLIPSMVIIAIAGAASLVLLLLVNKSYTGSYFISPYAYSRGLTKVQELTIDPARIAHNLAGIWRWAATDTLCFTFPFVFVAAAYGCLKEQRFRRELICLALLFPLLVAAYLFQGESSSSFDGERYYYEAYAVLCIVAARGLILLISQWRVRRTAAQFGLIALGAVHVLFIGIMIHDVEMRLAPWRASYRAAIAEPRPALVFLRSTTSAFPPKHADWNQARWKTAPTIFLNDPGPDREAAVACRFARPEFRIVTYDAASMRVYSANGIANCAAVSRSGRPGR